MRRRAILCRAIKSVNMRKWSDAAWAMLASRRIVISLILLWCALHLAARLLGPPGLHDDEAEILLYGQSSQWTYDARDPALLVWLAHFAFRLFGQLVGTSATTLFVFKYVLMAGGLLSYLAAARIALRDGRLAALAVLALLSSTVFLVTAHIALEFSILLFAASAVFVWALLRTLERGSDRDYLLLGLAVGLGLWTRYIFALEAACFALAIASIPELRQRLSLKGAAIAFTVAALIYAPEVVILLVHKYSLVAVSSDIVQGAGLHPAQWPPAALALLTSTALGWALPTVLFLALFGQSFRPIGTSLDDDVPRAILRMFDRANIAGFLIFGAGLIALGAARIRLQWLLPIVFTLPVALVMRAKLADVLTPSRGKILAGLLLLVAAAGVGGHFALATAGQRLCAYCHSYWPVQQLAGELARKGFVQGTIVSDDKFVAGSLQRDFGKSRSVWTSLDPAVFGEPGAGQCLLISTGASLAPPLTRFVADKLGVSNLHGALRGTFTTALPNGTSRTVAFSYALLPGAGSCR